MEEFIKINWVDPNLFSIVQLMLFTVFIYFACKFNELIASRTTVALDEFKRGKKWAIFSLMKNYWLGFSGSSVIVFMAFGLGGLTFEMDQMFLILTLGLWTFFLVFKNDVEKGESSFL